MGGNYAIINADKCIGLADYYFIGEAECTWPMFLRQWTKGEVERVYVQETFIDIKDSPALDWSLIDSSHYLNMTVQTSRGCPDQCDFCDLMTVGFYSPPLGAFHACKDTPLLAAG